MSRILITGMTSPQTSHALNKKSLSFAGVIENVLNDAGHTVSMCEPDMTWTKENLDVYDSIIVGTAPLSSLSANHAYGALHVIDQMYDSGKLALLIDAPQPSQIAVGLRSVKSKPENLTKPFYVNRRGYQLMKDTKVSKRILGTVDRLLDDNAQWPTVIYPSLPWKSATSVIDDLPPKAGVSVNGINLDAYLSKIQSPMDTARENRWASDSISSPWIKKTMNTLSTQVTLMKEHKGYSDAAVEERIGRSIGSLITPHRGGTWWSYRYVQSLNKLTPVATDWQESCNIGSSWNAIAATIEHMEPRQREELARAQQKEYLTSIPNKQEALNDLHEALNITAKNRKVTA